MDYLLTQALLIGGMVLATKPTVNEWHIIYMQLFQTVNCMHVDP